MRIINLSESNNAKAFETANLVHQREFDLVRRWISDRIDKAPKVDIQRYNCNKKFSTERNHDTITILGSRGSGKTSFLYSILNKFDQDSEAEVLEIIDPTLIEDKGHVFLTIVSLIKEEVERKLSKSDKDPTCQAFQQTKSWEHKLKSVAAGIPSIDGVGHGYEGWSDPEIIMNKGLKDVRAAKSLETDFQNLIEHALSILGKKAFIIAFDDIDINFKRGWPVLETIRKYLTSPHIITLLSGDLRLFSKAIRKRQWENFGKGLLINEGDRLNSISDYNDLVTEMEGQYLLKVLRTQRRVNLTTLLEKKNLERTPQLEIYIDDKGPTIENRYKSILSIFGINNPYQAEVYKSFLLSLPIRTQIQFLSVFESFDAAIIKKPKSNIFKEFVSNLKQLDFVSPFISDLYEKRIDIDIAKSNNTYLIPAILKLLIKEKVLNEGYQLQPTTLDTSLNSSLMTLSFLFSANTINNPYLIFDYMVRIGYVRNLLSNLGYRDDNNNKEGNQPSIEGLCNHASIYDDKVLKDVASYMTAYIQAAKNQVKTKSKRYNGIIELSGLKIVRGNKQIDSSMAFNSLFLEENIVVQTLAYLPFMKSENRGGYNTPSYSVYVLLGAIGELIRKANQNDLLKGLLELSQLRAYPMPSFEGMTIGESYDISLFDEDSINENENSLIDLKKSIENWIDKFKKENIFVSPHLLGKISTRFYYSLGNIERDNMKSTNLGKEMSRRIVSLLNAVLIEDIKENIENVENLNIGLNNPNKSSNVLIRNLSSVANKNNQKSYRDNIKFSRWMLSCPILLVFLDRNEPKLIKALSDFVGEKQITTLGIVYDALSKIDLPSSL